MCLLRHQMKDCRWEEKNVQKEIYRLLMADMCIAAEVRYTL
jgi:hypothetical protein